MRYELFYLIGASKEAELEKIKGEVKELVSALGGIFEEKEMFYQSVGLRLKLDYLGF